MSDIAQLVGVWVAAFFTLACFSFLFKQNPIYKFTEHLVVGVSAGYWVVILVRTSLFDLLINPLQQDFLAIRNGTVPGAGWFLSELALNLLPLALGLMMLLRLFPSVAWVGRIPIALVLGTGAGVAIPTAIETWILKPLSATVGLPIIPTSAQVWLASVAGSAPPQGELVGFWTAMNNLLIVAGVFCGVVYFFFSKEHKGMTGRAANIGIWVLMIGFGSTFGFTVMSRVSLLVGRFEFLINNWLIGAFWSRISG